MVEMHGELPQGDELQKQDGFALSLTPKAFFSVLATACYWSFIFAAYWGTSFIPETSQVNSASLFCKEAGFIGQACALAILFICWKRFSSPKGLNALVVLGICLCPFGALPMLLFQVGIILPLPLSLCFIFLFGCGHACLLCRTGFLLDALAGSLMGISLALALFFSCGLYVITINLPAPFPSVGILLLPWLCTLFISLSRPDRNLAALDLRGTILDKQSNLLARNEFRQFFIQVLFYSLVFSLMQLVTVVYDVSSPIASADSFWLVILLSGSAMLIYSVFVNRYLSPKVFLWYMLPLAAIGLLPFPLAGPDDRFICWLLIAFGFTFFDMMSLYHLSSFIKFNNLSIMRYFALGRFANALGMALGGFLGLVIFSNVYPDIYAVGTVTMILVIALIFMLIFFNRPVMRRPTNNKEEATPCSNEAEEVRSTNQEWH